VKEKIHIGTSGWVYKHWKGIFYPEKFPSADWLSYYAQFFNVTEINASFYRLQSKEAVTNWTSQVPPDFIFCPKMHRFLSHMKKLLDPEEPLERFFGAFDFMQKMMGPVLIQLPHFFPFKYDRAENLYRVLRQNYGDYEFVMEVRHDTWMHNESLGLMKKYNIGLVISQSGNEFPYNEMVTAKNIYIRLHGPSALYASSYDDETLKAFVRKFKRWVKEGHEVWTFFNNDIHGYAIANALRMKEMIEEGNRKN
jgi:uncharacterized protein YecE (DUF72 family)